MSVVQTIAAAREPAAATRANLSTVAVRTATPDDAPAIHALVTSNLEQGHLLPRALDDLVAHAGRFLVLAARGASPAAFGRRCIPAGSVAPSSNTGPILGRRALPAGRLAALDATPDLHHGLLAGADVLGCGEVAPLSRTVAEIRSLVVDAACRGRGLGSRLVDALKRRARADGHRTLCAFTHQPASFVRQGFSIVPHVWLPEKIATDCHACPLFRRCGQYAVSFSLDRLGRRAAAPAPGAREARA